MHGITELLAAEYDEATILEWIDDAIGDCIDLDKVAEFDGDINRCYKATGNQEAEQQVLQEILEPYAEALDPIEIQTIKAELAAWWGIKC
jgi:hypothetical protein